MDEKTPPADSTYTLHPSDWVEVRSQEEILASLDERGCLDALPFMPEMLSYCGKRFQVFKSAHKTCDTIKHYKAREMNGAVHLGGLRCDGSGHDGCQAGCLLFWKKAWLKRVDVPAVEVDVASIVSGKDNVGAKQDSKGIEGLLASAARKSPVDSDEGEMLYSCQATELLAATKPLHWGDPRQYLKDFLSRNVRLRDLIRYISIASFNVVMRLNWRGRPTAYPYLRGLAGDKTPTSKLNLQPGELVQVRPKEEIMPTLNSRLCNRGLSFDVEMVPYCKETFRVLRRVDKVIDEKNGRMIHLPNACIILDGVTCSGNLSRNRLFCPRSVYPYWRELWLKRIEGTEADGTRDVC